MARQPIVLIAVDGLDSRLLKRIADLEDLPHLTALLAAGALSQLQGPVHPAEGSTWASLLTGTDAGRHGIADGLQRLPGSYQFRPANARDLKAPTLWKIASHHGRRVGLLNVPLLYPPPSVNGYLVAGNDAPSYASPFTYPNGIAPLLAREHGSGTYQFDRELPLGAVEESILATHKLLRARIESYFALKQKFKYLDLQVVAFSAIGRLLIAFWSEIEQAVFSSEGGMPAWTSQFLDLFRQIDTFVGEILRQASNGLTFILLSTWSVGRYSGSFPTNNWLAQKGYLRLRAEAAAESLVESVDWQETVAYAPGPWGSIYLNLRGREPNGVVEPGGEAADLRRRLSRELREIEVQSSPLVTALYASEELYNGPFWAEAPDINLVLRDYSFLAGPWTGSGSPRPEGFVLFHHPEMHHQLLPTRPIEELAPTLLHLSNLPIPGRMKATSLGAQLGTLGEPLKQGVSSPEHTSTNSLCAQIEELKHNTRQNQAMIEAARANERQALKQVDELREQLAIARDTIQRFQAGRVIRFLSWLTYLKRRILGES